MISIVIMKQSSDGGGCTYRTGSNGMRLDCGR